MSTGQNKKPFNDDTQYLLALALADNALRGTDRIPRLIARDR